MRPLTRLNDLWKLNRLMTVLQFLKRGGIQKCLTELWNIFALWTIRSHLIPGRIKSSMFIDNWTLSIPNDSHIKFRSSIIPSNTKALNEVSKGVFIWKLGWTTRLDRKMSDPVTYDETTITFMSMELPNNFHCFPFLVKINGKTANLSLIFEYLNVT